MARVLVVDDDPTIRQLLAMNLELDGHEVDLAEDGEVALDRVAAQPPDLVLLDVMMPGIDGWEVASRLKAGPPSDAIPIVFVSAKAMRDDVGRGTALGAAAYVTKPFDPEELMQLVEALVGPADRSA